MVSKCFLAPTGVPCWLHFGVILEALGSFLASRSGIREVLEGFGNEVGKRDVPGGAAGVPASETHGGGSIMGGKSGHGEFPPYMPGERIHHQGFKNGSWTA